MKLIVDPKLGVKLSQIAKELEITESELVRESITEYLSKLKKPVPSELIQENPHKNLYTSR